MSDMFESIAKGLTEAIEHEQGKNTARRSTIKVEPPSDFNAEGIETTRCQTDIPESR